MSFSFGFTNDDFSDDELDNGGNIPDNSAPVEYVVVNPLDQILVSAEHAPKVHSLQEILLTLTNVRLTFDNYTTAGGNLVYRRELFDIKHQVMMEEQDTSQINQILVGDEGGNSTDLQKNVYEGGFKSWECSYDCIDHLQELLTNNKINCSSLLDLGCGTSLPTCYLLTSLITKKWQPASKSQTFVLSDFNYEVLRLVTLPNLIINWASTLDPEKLYQLSNIEGQPLQNDELLLTPLLLETFVDSLHSANISITFISGSWGRSFAETIKQFNVDYIISSETIYSVETLPVVAETVLDVLLNGKGTSLIAAKNIYFGVGGSVIEFVNYIKQQIKIRQLKVQVTRNEIKDSQLKRSLISIESS